LLTNDAKRVATIVHLDTETSFNLAQVFIELATQIRQPFVVGGFEN
jgi:hypothetical protein